MDTPLYTAILAVIGSYGLALVAFAVWDRQPLPYQPPSGERVVTWPVTWTAEGTGSTTLSVDETITLRATSDGEIEVVE